MDIVSYVGGRSDTTFPNLNFLLFVSRIFRKKEQNDFSEKLFSTKTISLSHLRKPFSLPQINFYPQKLLKKIKKIWWLFPSLACAFFASYGIIKACVYAESFANPLVLNSEYNAELESIELEMQRFALSSYDDISADGTIPGAIIKYSFKEPVTFTEYKVKSGETISGITKRFKLNNISTIIACNNIENVRSLNAGKRLIIPSVDGLIHIVKDGETISAVSKKYNVSIEDLLDVNDLTSEVLSTGTKLFIPGAKLDKNTLRKAMGDTFVCPIKVSSWRLSSKCGWRADPITGVRQYHPGIDLAISQGTPIYAALPGKVVVAGWSNVYGNYAIIDHGNGYQTLYGHMYKRICTLNQEVNSNTKIGLVGTTGYSTGPHLHFGVYKNGKVVDPLTLLK